MFRVKGVNPDIQVLWNLPPIFKFKFDNHPLVVWKLHETCIGVAYVEATEAVASVKNDLKKK